MNMKAVKETVARIKLNMEKHEGSNSDVYKYITESLDYVMEANSILLEKMYPFKERMRDNILEKLLKGELRYYELIEDAYPYNGNRFNVILIEYRYEDFVDDAHIMSAEINQTLLYAYTESFFRGRYRLIRLTKDRDALLLTGHQTYEEEDRLLVQEYLMNIRVLAECMDGLDIICGSGDFYGNILDVALSFGQAAEVIRYKDICGNSDIDWFTEIPDESHLYFYPEAIEQRLMGYIRNGEADRVEMLLDELYEGNIVKRQLSSDQIRQLVSEIRGTLVKAIHQLKLKLDRESFERIDILFNGPVAIVEYFDRLKEVADLLVKVWNDMDSKENEMKNIKEYIKKHYMEPTLTLEYVADEFGYTIVNLSTDFKHYCGMAFSSYVETIRIINACSLLSGTSLEEDEIAMKTGYESVKTFRKAFKKVKQMEPSDYMNKYM